MKRFFCAFLFTMVFGSFEPALAAVASPPSPAFQLEATLPLGPGGAARTWTKDKSLTVLVTLRNIRSQEQIFKPCGYGIWKTDVRGAYISVPPNCDYNASFHLKPGNSFPGVITLEVKAGPPFEERVLPKTIRIGLLPLSVSMCDAIVEGSSGQCGDANTSWSNTVEISR